MPPQFSPEYDMDMGVHISEVWNSCFKLHHLFPHTITAIVHITGYICLDHLYTPGLLENHLLWYLPSWYGARNEFMFAYSEFTRQHHPPVGVNIFISITFNIYSCIVIFIDMIMNYDGDDIQSVRIEKLPIPCSPKMCSESTVWFLM